MVNEKVLIRDKWRMHKRFLKFFVIFIVVLGILGGMFALGFFTKKPNIVLENPIADLVLKYTENGTVDKEAVVEQGILEFDEEYINYILVALGVGYLHKSPVFENPLIEFNLDEEVWNSEIIGGAPHTKRGEIDNEDLRIIISKEEAVNALLSDNIEQFMQDSVSRGRTRIEMVAGKAELFSKGYLDMYEKLTGNEININDY